MLKPITLLVITWVAQGAIAQNLIPIPPTIEDNAITLTLEEGTTEFFPGIMTMTMGANGSLLGPTLILHQDSLVSITVDNQLSMMSTIHWHGLHVAPEDDGGPHSMIPAGQSWNPEFTVLDKAGIFWYHPHPHMMTNEQVAKGIAGMIIVKDSEEAALNLPRTYGIDDFPIIMQTKAFDGAGQIEVMTEGDTSILVNGVREAYTNLPAQVVRLRLLNGATQRVMEIGFSDDRNFSLIGTDGGLLTAPVSLTRYRMGPGQRADILLDLSGQEGTNFQLMSYGSELPNAYYGAAQPGMGAGATLPGYNLNYLNGADFQLLDLFVVAQTANPVTSLPLTLANFTPLIEGQENNARELVFTSAGAMGDLTGPFLINNAAFDMEVINFEVGLNDIEIWSLRNQTPISHPFHVHDVQFFILDINGTPPPVEMQGLHDVVLVPAGNTTVRIIAHFANHASDTMPYMYHCHMLTHEDGGMMGQFLVLDPNSALDELKDQKIQVYPNPSANGEFTIELNDKSVRAESIDVLSVDGKLVQRKRVTGEGEMKITLDAESGVYYLVVHSDEGILKQRIVVTP